MSTSQNVIPTEKRLAALVYFVRGEKVFLDADLAIMRTFVQLRRLMDNNRDLARHIDSLEARYDEKIFCCF